MSEDQILFYILAAVWAMDTSLVGVMLWWGRKEWTPPQYGRFVALFLVCAQRVYINIMVAPKPRIKFEWNLSGTTLAAGLVVFGLMIWSWVYNIRGGGPHTIKQALEHPNDP
jgi:H+/Cl- antiporter ClcA